MWLLKSCSLVLECAVSDAIEGSDLTDLSRFGPSSVRPCIDLKGTSGAFARQQPTAKVRRNSFADLHTSPLTHSESSGRMLLSLVCRNRSVMSFSEDLVAPQSCAVGIIKSDARHAHQRLSSDLTRRLGLLRRIEYPSLRSRPTDTRHLLFSNVRFCDEIVTIPREIDTLQE
ncbi:hypothetical protein Bealeia2_02060 (plasmid) [Candidatus Bealeia paramacronuclearis]|nr:hypothetical protein [Candidatus Bealeia paramacronuclearis]